MPITQGEQRRYTRKSVSSAGEVRFPPGSKSGINVRMIDISAGGARLACPASPPLKSKCSVSFFLPNISDTEVVATAVVIRSIRSPNEGGFLLGLEFKDLPTETLGLIESFVNAS